MRNLIVGILGEMTYSTTTVQIIMIKEGASDDKITIRKDFSTNEFEILYVDDNDGIPVTHKASGLYRERVLEYVYMVLKNQALDDEGYDSVQFTIPAMPRVIVPGSDFKDLYKREHFYSLISTGLDMLENCESINKRTTSAFTLHTPTNRTTLNRTTINPAMRHLFFDE